MRTSNVERRSTSAPAAAFAAHVLHETKLPAGSKPCAPGAGPGPSAPAVRLGLSPLTDRHACFLLPLSPAETASALRTELPAGAAVTGSGSGSRPSGTQFFLQLKLPVRGPNQYEAQLVETWVARSGGGSVLRVDAEVVWLPTRPRGSLLRHVHSATLTGYAALSLLNPPKGQASVTLSGARLATVVAAFNALAEGPRAACMEDTPVYRLQFSTARGTVSVRADECESSVFSHSSAEASLTLSDRSCVLAHRIAPLLPQAATASRRWAAQCRPS